MVAKFPGVVYARVTQPTAARTISLAWRKKALLSSAAEALKKVILSTIKI